MVPSAKFSKRQIVYTPNELVEKWDNGINEGGGLTIAEGFADAPPEYTVNCPEESCGRRHQRLIGRVLVRLHILRMIQSNHPSTFPNSSILTIAVEWGSMTQVENDVDKYTSAGEGSTEVADIDWTSEVEHKISTNRWCLVTGRYSSVKVIEWYGKFGSFFKINIWRTVYPNYQSPYYTV